MIPLTPEVCDKALALVRQHGSIRAAARASGICFGTIRLRYKRALELGLGSDSRPVLDVEPLVRGRVHAMPRVEWPLPKRRNVQRYLFTCAQNNTHLHEQTWENLLALAAYYKARLCISRFTYDKASYGRLSVKPGKTATTEESAELWYDPRIAGYLVDESIVIAPGLVWCGEMNILPTAVRPLSGLESYTGRKSGIFPHVKFAMDSIASGKNEATKFNYTTGTITQRNYIAKKTGLKAEFHHGYGALLVEVDPEGNWYCRQINADSGGVLHDLTLRVEAGRVLPGQRVEGISWGDIHIGTVPADVLEMNWGKGGVIDVLKPKFQFMHDVLNFRSRNHHEMRDPHKMFEKYVEGTDGVVDELEAVAGFLTVRSWRTDCQTVVVDSNHDNAMTRWLREADYRCDPKNALFFLKAQLQVYQAIARRDKKFHVLEWAMNTLHPRGETKAIRFLRPDESFILCLDANGGIECGMHGHKGPNGARGSLFSLAKMGRKSNTGHSHSAGIIDGAYRAGVTGDFDQGYNIGPSSWSRTHIITYANGKRAMLTTWAGKWRV